MIKPIKNDLLKIICLTAAIFTFCSRQAVVADDTELKGNVEETEVSPSKGIIKPTIEPMPTPVMTPKLAPQKATVDETKLQGNAKDNSLNGTVEKNGQTGLKSGAAKTQPTAPLKASATKQTEDPDLDDQELVVEWDRWRNRFLWAVQSEVNETLNTDESNMEWDDRRGAMVNKTPLGACTWFSCQITPGRQIVNLKLVRSSGYPSYDKVVLESIRDLSGSSLLQYPARSKRKIVMQEAGIETSQTGERKTFKFNDVERRIIPGNR